MLGLSGRTITRTTIIASVVYRGALWLDGVATTMIEPNERNYERRLTELIKTSKQFSQVHAIIISPRLTVNLAISIHDLARRTKLPVIAITKPHERPRLGNRDAASFAIRVNGKRVVARLAGVDREAAERLYKNSCFPPYSTPEAVRIADLLMKELGRTFK